MNEVMFGVNCMMCQKEIGKEVGDKSYRILIYGSEIEEKCSTCESHLVEKLEAANVNLYCCSSCAEAVVDHMSKMYRQVKGYEGTENQTND